MFIVIGMILMMVGATINMAILYIVLIYLGISLIWCAAEKVVYGKVTPRILDDIVAIVLAISLYFNLS